MSYPKSIAAFFEHLALPRSSEVGKRIFKKLFYKNGQLNATDKKAFQEDIDFIEIRNSLSPSSANIQAYRDDENEYEEIQILHVALSSGKRVSRIADVIQKAIPYPVVIVASCNDDICINAALKRINKADQSKLVIEEAHETGWFSLASPEEWQQDFLKQLHATTFSFQNLYDFYTDAVNRIIAFKCASHTGEYTLLPQEGGKAPDRASSLQRLEELEKELAGVRNQLKKEKNMGGKVRLNILSKSIKDAIAGLKKNL